MLIGVDFDNTIVCYDALFHTVAVDQGWIPLEVPAGKEQVRDYLRQRGAEDTWTELQGQIYGTWIDRAPPFPGVLDFFKVCQNRGIEVHIVSHRTLRPCRGPDCDLHAAAARWLSRNQFHQMHGIQLPVENVHLEVTQEKKLQRIAEIGCSHFVDDLFDFLLRPDFPASVQRILFDPHRRHAKHSAVWRAEGWSEVLKLIE